MAESSNHWKINLLYLPIKAHYFFLYGAMGGVIPFMTLLAKGLGISATAVGLTYTVLPFCVLLSKPVFGYLTDYFRNMKAILIALAIVTAVSFMLVLLIQPIPEKAVTNMICSDAVDGERTLRRYHQDCFVHKLELQPRCNFIGGTCASNCSSNCDVSHANITVKLGSSPNSWKNSSTMYIGDNLLVMNLEDSTGIDSICDCVAKNPPSLSCESSFSECIASPDEQPSVFKTYQYWVFTLLAVISGTGSATAFCLSDAACYEVLGDRADIYGRQRLWATISWGLVTLSTGYLNDLASAMVGYVTYSPGFYLMVAFVILDLIVLIKIQLTKANFSTAICKDVGKIFSSSETVAFATGIFIAGALTGLIWNYEFWYLQDMQATQTLLGLTVAVQCLVAEVPFFFFAGWFIEKFGHFYCLSMSFAAFALRLGLYCVLKDPWWVLPIEVLHGITFAVAYTAMTSYASQKAPPGTEATMMGVLGGLYEGLGVAVGSLLGGVGFDNLGGRNTFFTASIISLVCTPAFIVIHVVHKFLAKPEKISAPL